MEIPKRQKWFADKCPPLGSYPNKSPPAPRAKVEMQKPQGWGKFLVQIPGGAWRGMVMDEIDTCIIPKFKLKYDDLKNIKTDRVNTVVFNLHQINQLKFFLKHPVLGGFCPGGGGAFCPRTTCRHPHPINDESSKNFRSSRFKDI